MKELLTVGAMSLASFGVPTLPPKDSSAGVAKVMAMEKELCSVPKACSKTISTGNGPERNIHIKKLIDGVVVQVQANGLNSTKVGNFIRNTYQFGIQVNKPNGDPVYSLAINGSNTQQNAVISYVEPSLSTPTRFVSMDIIEDNQSTIGTAQETLTVILPKKGSKSGEIGDTGPKGYQPDTNPVAASDEFKTIVADAEILARDTEQGHSLPSLKQFTGMVGLRSF